VQEVHILKTGIERFLCGLLQHILKNIFVKLLFKTFTLENSKKKGSNIFPRPGIRSLSGTGTPPSWDSNNTVSRGIQSLIDKAELNSYIFGGRGWVCMRT
jgi:hypothetical protein